MSTQKQEGTKNLTIECIDQHLKFIQEREGNDLPKVYVTEVLDQIKRYAVMDESSQSTKLSEKDKEIERLKDKIEKYAAIVYDLQHSSKSQPDSKGGYDELLEFIEQAGMKSNKVDFISAMIIVKEKILSLSSKEESKSGRDVEFGKWVINNVSELYEGDDWYSEGYRYRIDLTRAQNIRVKTFQDVYKKFLSITPPTSKVEAKPMMKIHSESRRKFNSVPVSIPMSLLNEEQAKSNHGQSLEKLNSRGGLGIGEILDIIHKRKWGTTEDSLSSAYELNKIISESIAKPSQKEGEKKTAEEILAEEIGVLEIDGVKWDRVSGASNKIISAMKKHANQFRPTDSKEAVDAKPMSIDECKDAMAKKYGYTNFMHAANDFRGQVLSIAEIPKFIQIVNESITLYANQSK